MDLMNYFIQHNSLPLKRKESEYGLTCPFFVYLDLCEGLDRDCFYISLHWEGGEAMIQKKRKYGEKYEGAHIWATVQKSG